MWQVNCPKLIAKIEEVHDGLGCYAERTLNHWEHGEKPAAKTILKLEIDLDIDFKDYIIVTKEPENIIERVIFLREINAFTQSALSEEMGLDRTSVGRLERDEIGDEATENYIVKFSEVFGCRRDYFKKGGEPYRDKRLFR